MAKSHLSIRPIAPPAPPRTTENPPGSLRTGPPAKSVFAFRRCDQNAAVSVATTVSSVKLSTLKLLTPT